MRPNSSYAPTYSERREDLVALCGLMNRTLEAEQSRRPPEAETMPSARYAASIWFMKGADGATMDFGRGAEVCRTADEQLADRLYGYVHNLLKVALGHPQIPAYDSGSQAPAGEADGPTDA